jgi:hypothetical protein
MVGMVGGVGVVLGQIGLLADTFAFSARARGARRPHGHAPDAPCGLRRPRGGAVWDNLLAELRITGGKDAGKRGDIFDTHPTRPAAATSCCSWPATPAAITGADRYRKAIAPLRWAGCRTRVKRGQYEESLVLFDRMLARGAGDAEVLYRARRGPPPARRCGRPGPARPTSTRPAAGPGAGGDLPRAGAGAQAAQRPCGRGQAFETYLAQAPQARMPPWCAATSRS